MRIVYLYPQGLRLLTSHDALVYLLAEERSLERLVGYLQIERIRTHDNALEEAVGAFLATVLVTLERRN